MHLLTRLGKQDSAWSLPIEVIGVILKGSRFGPHSHIIAAMSGPF